MLDDKDYEMMQQMDPDHGSRYNGEVTTDEGDTIKIKNGVAVVDGQMFFVSNDGSMVTDGEGGLIAVIQDGKIMEATPEIVDQLRAEGMVE